MKVVNFHVFHRNYTGNYRVGQTMRRRVITKFALARRWHPEREPLPGEKGETIDNYGSCSSAQSRETPAVTRMKNVAYGTTASGDAKESEGPGHT